MTPTILILLGGLSTMLVGVGLLGTLLGVRANLAAFSNLDRYWRQPEVCC